MASPAAATAIVVVVRFLLLALVVVTVVVIEVEPVRPTDPPLLAMSDTHFDAGFYGDTVDIDSSTFTPLRVVTSAWAEIPSTVYINEIVTDASGAMVSRQIQRIEGAIPQGAEIPKFGFTLSLRMNDLVVGAPGDSANGPDEGTVYSYTWDSESGQFALVQSLRPPNPPAVYPSLFGYLVKLYLEESNSNSSENDVLLVAEPQFNDPQASGTEGALHYYQRSARDAPWLLARTIAMPISMSPDSLGLGSYMSVLPPAKRLPFFGGAAAAAYPQEMEFYVPERHVSLGVFSAATGDLIQRIEIPPGGYQSVESDFADAFSISPSGQRMLIGQAKHPVSTSFDVGTVHCYYRVADGGLWAHAGAVPSPLVDNYYYFGRSLEWLDDNSFVVGMPGGPPFFSGRLFYYEISAEDGDFAYTAPTTHVGELDPTATQISNSQLGSHIDAVRSSTIDGEYIVAVGARMYYDGLSDDNCGAVVMYSASSFTCGDAIYVPAADPATVEDGEECDGARGIGDGCVNCERVLLWWQALLAFGGAIAAVALATVVITVRRRRLKSRTSGTASSTGSAATSSSSAVPRTAAATSGSDSKQFMQEMRQDSHLSEQELAQSLNFIYGAEKKPPTGGGRRLSVDTMQSGLSVGSDMTLSSMPSSPPSSTPPTS